jgi:bifunctional non-homologous end joining protein LigD
MSMPVNIKPMLASLGKGPFDNKGWGFEIKYDGYRIISYIRRGVVELKSKNNLDYTKRFRPIADALSKWRAEAVIDGEIVVLNEQGVSDFEALIEWKSDEDGELCYYVFDLLYYNGINYMNKPFKTRKAALKRLLRKSDEVRYCTHIEQFGNAAFKMAITQGLEGIIAKKADSLYAPGVRSNQWLKIKTYKVGKALIVGYTRQDGPALISSLLLAELREGMLVYLGEVGTGFSEKQIKEILAQITILKKCPLPKVPVLKGRWGRKAPTTVVWCRPQLACKIQYLGITRSGELRHASYKGLIPD